MPFHTGVFGHGSVYLTPPADVPDGTRAYVYILAGGEDPISFYRRLVLIEPEDARLYHQLGLAQLEAGRLGDAEASLNRAVQLDFGFAEAHLTLGRCYERQGEGEQALHAYRVAADLAPDEPTMHRHLIAALLAADRQEEAFAALEKGLSTAPRLRAWVDSADVLEPLRQDARWAAVAAQG